MNMEKKSGIYMWTSPSGKSYIGQSVNLADRRREFVRFDQYYAGHRINNARKKYNNESDWEYKVLEYCEPSELNEKEIYYIALYDTYHNGYNQCIGGSTTLGYKFTDEQKKKLSIALTGKKQSEETKQKKREKLSGVNNPFYGKHHDYETRKIMSDKKKGLYDGAKHPRAYPIVQLTLDGEFIKEYGCAKEAANELGINRRGIGRCISGELKQSHGFKWMKATDYYATHTYKNPPLLKKNEGLNKN